MAVKNKYVIAPNLKASTVRRLMRQGYTAKQIASDYGFANTSMLYKRFGAAIVGIAKRGRPRKVAI